jgi:hypothetical protein
MYGGVLVLLPCELVVYPETNLLTGTMEGLLAAMTDL